MAREKTQLMSENDELRKRDLNHSVVIEENERKMQSLKSLERSMKDKAEKIETDLRGTLSQIASQQRTIE